MLPRLTAFVGGASLLALASACTIGLAQRPESSSERTRREFIERHEAQRQAEQAQRDARDEQERARKRKEEGPELPPLGDCPSDMSVSPGPRQIDTRQLPEAKMDLFTKGHQLPPPDSFFSSKDMAVELVLSAEKKTPGLIPLGFRDAVRASPRDATLRLRMARCELEHDETRRRASYDAALAILMSGSSDPALAILIESTRNQTKRKLISSCRDNSECEKGWTCDPVQKWCTSKTEQLTSHISASEFEVEDAITRALLEPGMTFEQYKGSDYFWWCATRLHRCGGVGNAPCQLTGYDGKVVSWDLRDGGRTYESAPKVQQWYRDHCARGSTDDCDQKKPSWVP